MEPWEVWTHPYTGELVTIWVMFDDFTYDVTACTLDGHEAIGNTVDEAVELLVDQLDHCVDADPTPYEDYDHLYA